MLSLVAACAAARRRETDITKWKTSRRRPATQQNERHKEALSMLAQGKRGEHAEDENTMRIGRNGGSLTVKPGGNCKGTEMELVHETILRLGRRNWAAVPNNRSRRDSGPFVNASLDQEIPDNRFRRLTKDGAVRKLSSFTSSHELIAATGSLVVCAFPHLRTPARPYQLFRQLSSRLRRSMRLWCVWRQRYYGRSLTRRTDNVQMFVLAEWHVG